MMKNNKKIKSMINFLDSIIPLTVADNISNLNEIINDYDLPNKIRKIEQYYEPTLDKWKKRFADTTNILGKDFQEDQSSIKVRVAYDAEKDNIQSKFEDNVLTIGVYSKSEKDKYNTIVTTTIPDNAMVDKMVKQYDKVNKIMTFIIPKKKDVQAIKTDKIKKLIESYKQKKNDLKKQLQDEIDKINFDAEDTSKDVKKDSKKEAKD